MPKLKNTNKTIPLVIAGCLVLLGAIGLAYAVWPPGQEPTQTSVGGELRVIDSTGTDPRLQQATDGILQGAARTKDFGNNQGSENFQQTSGVSQGTSIDELLKDKEIR